MQKRLLDEMFKKYSGLAEIKAGQGNKRYIYKKEDEEKIIALLKTKRKKKIGKNTQNEYDEIKQYCYKVASRQDFPDFKIGDIRRSISKHFQIKQDRKLNNILRELKIDGVLKTTGPGIIKVVPPARRK